jgi:hypothetical protein
MDVATGTPSSDHRSSPCQSESDDPLVIVPGTLARPQDSAKDNKKPHPTRRVTQTAAGKLDKNVGPEPIVEELTPQSSDGPIISSDLILTSDISASLPPPGLSVQPITLPAAVLQGNNNSQRSIPLAVRSHPSVHFRDPSFQDRISQQSAAAHIAVQQGDSVRNLCYGPVQFSDLTHAYNECKAGRAILDYSLLKRLDEVIFHRGQDEMEYVSDGGIRRFVLAAETRLLSEVQHFMVTAAVLPMQTRFFEGIVDPDPLVRFVDDVEALVHYMVEDIRGQRDVFSPSNVNLLGFIEERIGVAHHRIGVPPQSPEKPSFYFRHPINDVTVKYVQGLCETICGLWPNGRFFISAEGVNPCNSFTHPPVHRQRNPIDEITTTSFEDYFSNNGILANTMASDFRQLFRGAFPFLVGLTRQLEGNNHPIREREISVDAAFIEGGVFKFVRTTFIREHLLVDHDRKVRIYVDDVEGTKYLVYFNHRVGRWFSPVWY